VQFVVCMQFIYDGWVVQFPVCSLYTMPQTRLTWRYPNTTYTMRSCVPVGPRGLVRCTLTRPGISQKSPSSSQAGDRS